MIAIIKYNAGNTKSVQNALTRLGYKSIITDDHDAIKNADKVIFPGVGSASSAMKYMKKHQLDLLIPSLIQPVLGICLGLQLMCKSSEEGNTTCLGIFDTTVKKFPADDLVPQMGWNSFVRLSGSLFKGINVHDDVYYVHSYYAELCVDTVAVCNYTVPFSSAIRRDNFYATQFHPEKSAGIGEHILKNFLAL
ncbi:MAG: imidazole glycerol phosphate synthase subunit HisH [Flavobacteriales bacterium]|nr:imidazole glycerol phosphate synthase subunit HisH [Flavobacteriales bacterium]